jgi:PAS domain S-box-containing protein
MVPAVRDLGADAWHLPAHLFQPDLLLNDNRCQLTDGYSAPPPTELRAGLSGFFDEQARLRVLAEHALEADCRDGALDALTSLAAEICGAPICLVSLVDSDHQRFIASIGLAATQTPRDASFCQHAMMQPDIMVVPDALADPRFANNALVRGEPHIRFYAGAPLLSAEGAPLGALCVIDSTPRDGLTPLQAKTLSVLAEQVRTALDARRRAKQRLLSDRAFQEALVERENRFRVLADSMPQMVWSTRPDGYHDYYNARWYEFTGMPPGSTDGQAWNGMFHADDQERAWARWRHSLATGEPYEIEYRLRNASGDYRWTLGRALPMRGPDGDIVRWFGTCTDIHEQKLAEEQRQLVSQELSHRIKNIFSIISGMISLAARRHPEARTMADDLRERIVALGRAHDVVRPHSSASRPEAPPGRLQGTLRQIFLPYDGERGPRIAICGDNPIIDDHAATPFALLFHELATNAVKYGALSHDGGQVKLDIRQIGDRVELDWIETGGPPITKLPDHEGFGTQLIEIGALRQLGGQLRRVWLPEGLHFTVSVPLSSLCRTT